MNSIWGGSKIKFNTSRGGSGENVLMQTKKIPPTQLGTGHYLCGVMLQTMMKGIKF
jgi:hypothetical protein